MGKNKKGVSPILATVFIIMLSIAAIGILAGFLVPFVKNSLYGRTECMAYEGYYTFDESFGYNCYKSESIGNNTLYAVSIKASSKKELANNTDGFKIVFIDEKGLTTPVEIKNGLPSSHQEKGVWIMGYDQPNLEIPGPGSIITYGYNNSEKERFEAVEVYPILKSGRICADEKDSIKVVKCETGKAIF